ncbi:MAG: porin [Algoriphagus sp.]|nr:porin [Algoriphagus sp.]
MKSILSLFFACLGLAHVAFSQVTNSGLMNTTTGEQLGNLSIGAYIDAYFGYDFSRPQSGDIPYFVSMNRHNEANINLAFLDVRYTSDRIRGRFVPGFGTYMNANYSNEKGSLKNLVEASAGYRISKTKDIWVDFGILGSPYTNESAISRDHLMYTRSFAPEYVPYYLSGAKVSIPISEKLSAYLYLLNGWQQIQDQNRGKAIGTQLEYRPDNKNLFNWNTYFGDERSTNRPNDRMRAFSDIYWIHDSGNWDFTSCLYGGFQNNKTDRFNEEVFWWQANFIARYSFTEKVSLSGRLEYFSDPNAIQISPETLQPSFNAFSNGLCLNFSPSSNLLLRLEGRYFYSEDEVFYGTDNQSTRQKTWLVSNVTFSF